MKISKLSLLIALTTSFAVAVPTPHDDDHDDVLSSGAASAAPSASTSVMIMGHHGSQNHGANHSMEDMEPSPAKMGAHHHHGRPILDDPNLEPQQRAYWEQYNTTTFFSAPSPAKGFLWGHVVLNVASWVFIFPIALVLGIEQSPFYLPVQTLFSGMMVVALMFLGIYGATAPDLYENNSYSRASVAMFFIVVVHWLAATVKTLANWAISSTKTGPLDGADYILGNLNANGQYTDVPRRLSDDSGHGITSPTGTSNRFNDDQPLREDIVPNSTETEDEEDEEDKDMYMFGGSQEELVSQTSFESKVQNRLISRIMSNKMVAQLVMKLGTVADSVYTILNRPLLVLGFYYLLLGIATVYCMGIDNNVYNILAHFIKGGVFFLFGLVTLSRYLGAFADLGMAWNVRPGSDYDPLVRKNRSTKDEYGYMRPKDHQGLPPSIVNRILSKFTFPSMEFVESFLIFVYGSSNIFLEHLGNKDGAWSHKDLQHASIAFMYLGGGICGLLVESSSVRRLLARITQKEEEDDSEDETHATRHAYSFNPFPAFIVFWTGVLMSKHQQALELSTEIHTQWGTLLCVAAVFRLMTYLLMFLSAPKSTVPVRPFTELLVSFCLICGGMVFMESNSETVEAMIYRGLDGMFTLNVNVGVTALLMGWIMIIMTIKGLAHKRK